MDSLTGVASGDARSKPQAQTFQFELLLSRVFVSYTLRRGLSGWRCRWSGGDPKPT